MIREKLRKLRIGVIAPLWYRIPPDNYGGIELVVYNLVEGLVQRGHQVTLFAAGDAQTSAKLVATAPSHLKAQRYGWNEFNYPLLNIAKAMERASRFDIIHSHVDELALFFSRLIDTPMVSTTHNPFDRRNPKRPSSRLVVYDYFYPHPLVSISQAQQKTAKIKGHFGGMVYNGIDPALYRFNPSPKKHFIWIGRFGHHKGPVEAITAAKRAGAVLKLAGRIDQVERRFFQRQIRPRLVPRQIFYVGAVAGSAKNQFFSEARALLYPIDWEEPFGLVMVEAMACGTPVIAFNRGSVPEIVAHGKTGFVVDSLQQMVYAMKRVEELNRENCRKRVENMFSVAHMVAGYEKIYYDVIAKYKKNR